MITRFAPSLTGYLHLGHVLHMIYVWGVARREGGKVLIRIEDHDIARNRPEYEPAILADMQWLGFVPDLGITESPAPKPSPYRQSDCASHYEETLHRLAEKDLVYGCECSRRQIMQLSNGGTPSPASVDSEDAVPPKESNELCYPGTCSGKGLPLEGNTVRFRITEGEVSFTDLLLGECRQVPVRQCGDFPLRDRSGQWSYQFCCVCDDIRQDVDCVVRGEDILSSTGRQILLFHAMEREPPRYVHHPLLRDASGRKLSKRRHAESITLMREKGMPADEVIGRAAHEGGLIPGFVPLSAEAAITQFNTSTDYTDCTD